MSMYRLTDDQLLLLDGHADADMQAVIDGIKLARSTGNDVPLVGEVIANALRDGVLSVISTSGRYCPVCKSSAGYAKHKGRGRYHKKGDDNHDKPLSMGGVYFQTSFVFIRGHIHACHACNKSKGIEAAIERLIISQELPVELQNSPQTLFKKDAAKQCFQCCEVIYESEMIRERTIMGDGTYPCGCPKCGARSVVFGPAHKVLGDKFRMVRVSQTGKDSTSVSAKSQSG